VAAPLAGNEGDAVVRLDDAARRPHPPHRVSLRPGGVALSQRGDGHDPRSEPTLAAKTVVLTVDLETLSGFPPSALRPSNRYLYKSYRKGVIRCVCEQSPLPSWSPRLFLPWEVPRPQLAGRGAIATGILRLRTIAATPASASAGLATEQLAFAGWVLAAGVGRSPSKTWPRVPRRSSTALVEMCRERLRLSGLPAGIVIAAGPMMLIGLQG
jgi:hypothetical protein